MSRRQDVALVVQQVGLSERRACELLGIDRSSYRYAARPEREAEMKQELARLAHSKPRYGYRRLTVLLQRQGRKVNHKRVGRWCRELSLTVRRRRRKRLVGEPVPQAVLTAANQEWAMDFVSDALASGQALRALPILEGFTRESLAIEVATSLGSRRVTRVLERIAAERGSPARIRVDNGPEFTSAHFLSWCAERGIQVVHIEPGKPVQNATMESFNGRFRDECLNTSWFWNLAEAREKIGAWQQEYNQERPHSALGYRTPAEFAAQARAAAQAALTGRPTGAAWASAPACATQVGNEGTILMRESHL